MLQSGANNLTGEVRNDTILIHCVEAVGIAGVASDGDSDFASVGSNVISDRLNLNLNVDGLQTVNVSLYNAAGAQVFGQKYDVAGSRELTVGGLGNLSDGIYVLKVESADGRYVKKLIKR